MSIWVHAWRGTAVGAAGILLATQFVSPSPATAKAFDPGAPLSQQRISAHLTELEKIADTHDGHRASGTEGHAASVTYVERLLRAAGYETHRQEFSFRYTETLEEELTLRGGASPAVVAAGYSPSTPEGGIERRLAVPAGGPERQRGCDSGAYQGVVTAGRIALVRSGGCSMDAKEHAAAQAGASAVLIANEGPGELHSWLGDPDAARIPIGGVSREAGRALEREARADRPVRLTLRSLTERRTTENLIAVSPQGDPDHTVAAGAHLDSTPDGPGINDNGVATAVLLESALTLARGEGRHPANRLVFAFWGAEEYGLLGSQHYVDSLSAEERDDTELYLNLEMIGSSNHALFTLDPDAADPVTGQRPAPGSDAIARRLTDAFAAQGRRSLPGPADGRSDYVPFVGARIPTGGLYGGSFEAKTPEQAALWGGTAGAPYDSCYHLPCDRTDHYGREAAKLHGTAFHRVLAHYAQHRLTEEGPASAAPGSGGS